MTLLHSIPFPDAAISWAGVGRDPDLYWWIATDDSAGERKVKAARRQEGALTVLGSIAPVGRQVVVRFARNGAALLVINGETLHRLSFNRPGESTSEFNLGDSSVTHVDSLDARIIFLARSLRWPPIRRLDSATGDSSFLEPQRHNVSKHHPLLALSPDGRHLAFGHVFDAIEIFEISSGTSTPWLQSVERISVLEMGHSDMLAHLDFTSDGKHLVAVSHPRSPDDPHILRVGGIGGQEIRDHALVNHLPIVGVAAGGQWVAAAGRNQLGQVEIIDLVTGVINATVDVGRRVKALAFDEKAERLTIVHAGGVDICVC